MIDEKALGAIAARALEAVKREAPQSEAEVRVSTSREANVRFALNEIVSGGDAMEETVELTVAIGKRHATITGNQPDDASLVALAKRAVAMAKLAPEDPERMPPLPPQKYATAADGFDRAMAEMSAESRAATAQVALATARKAGVQGAGFFEHSGRRFVLVNSAGLRASYGDTYGALTMTARTSDGTGSGWAVTASHRASGLDASAVARVATDKAARSARPRPLAPGRYTVVLEPAAVAELLQYLDFDARAVDEGHSAFIRPGGGSRVGEKIASDLVTIGSDWSDPELPLAPFDPEGLPRRSMTWIDRGVLRMLRYSRYWAAKQGKEPTPGAGAWRLMGGAASSVDELVAGVKRGLLVTRFWYTGSLDPQLALATGLTRDGVFLIEEGRVVAPVNNFRFNESPLTMLRNCDALTRETWRTSPWTRVPALRTHEFNMESVSDAV